MFALALLIVFLVLGVLREAFRWKGVCGILLLVVAAVVTWRQLAWPPYLFISFVMLIDIVLLFVVLKGDVTIR